ARRRQQVRALPRRHRGDDEEHGVRAEGARLVDLVRVDQEVLAQAGEPRGRARRGEVLERAAEEGAVGQHRQRRRPGRGVAARDGGGVVGPADLAARGRGALQLRDDGGRRARRERGAEAAAGLPTPSAAAALRHTTSRPGPRSPPRMARRRSAASATEPTRNTLAGAGASPASAAVTERTPSAPPATSTTALSPSSASSSRPPAPCTTHARSTPRRTRTCATGSSQRRSNTPITWRRTPAGLASGPSRLKSVRTPSSPRGAAACRSAGWGAGAKRTAKPTVRRHAESAGGG